MNAEHNNALFPFPLAIADIIDRNRPILVVLIDQTKNLCIFYQNF